MKRRGVLIGINGFGFYWRKTFIPYVANVEGKLEVVGAYNRSEKGFDLVQEDLGLRRDQCYTDLRQMLEETRPDFVMIIVPPQVRESVIDLALEYDCDIITEKPLAMDMEACVRIARKVEQRGKKLCVTMTHRMARDKQTLLKEIQSGAHGPVANITGSLTVARQDADYEDTWRQHMDYYYMFDAAIHQLDILRALSGSNARKLYCKGWAPEWAAFKQVAAYNVIVEMENGVIGNYQVSSCSAANLNWWYQDYIRVDCRDSVLVLDAQKLTAHRGRQISWDAKMNITRENIDTDIPLLGGERWTNSLLLSQFIDWINGGEPPVTTVNDNLYSMAMLFAAIESIKTGREIDVRALYDAACAE